MVKQIEVTGKTVGEALEEASRLTEKPAESLKYTVIEEGKKGFLGVGGTDAVIRVSYELDPEESAKLFLETFVKNMGIENASVVEGVTPDGETKLEIVGDDLGIIIGRHGETLDSLQYLANLAANRRNRSYSRIVVDIENYRAKRVDTLNALAAKVASRVKKSGKSITLEPMNPYERRIIHARIQKIDGVTTYSIGAGDDRKVVVSPEGAKKITPPEKHVKSEKKAEEKKPQVKYEYNPVREPKHIVKAKSIDELGLADVDDTEEVILN